MCVNNALFLGFGIGVTFNNYFAPDSGVGYENFATNLTLPLNKFGIDFRLRPKSALSVMAGLQMITAPYMDEYEDTKHYYYTIKHKLKYGYFIQIGYKF